MPSGLTLGLVSKMVAICLVFVNVDTFTGLSVTDLLSRGHRCNGVHLYNCVVKVPNPIGIVDKNTLKNFVSLGFEFEWSVYSPFKLINYRDSLLASPMNQQM